MACGRASPLGGFDGHLTHGAAAGEVRLSFVEPVTAADENAGAEGRGERLAAMTSAMLALAAAVGRELVLGDLQTLMLEAAGGKVLMLAIQAEGRAPLLLMAACDQRSVIGQVLWQSRECGQAILAELGGS